ncbi:hypothetical protein G6O69_28040 [Pseudenhygromyxa sp. WMMC2535]|uniref:hypothetical protein n=1 Tax=Pseudenhygromyxa sp. WMMC2535 TaxID=2712867 RepID=UPI001552FCCA|nr:hypothetical protein [Pseudenhygromyxa sp. WMMC2535]NVB41717.1 hypothetical protein [Pseudenhygromyxa sp. WMMC2535]
MDEPPSKPPPADPFDVDSIDGIVNALYDSVSFAEGTRPNWDRFRSLFDPRALMVRVDPRQTARPPTEREGEPIRASSIDEYVARTTAAIDSGALTAFVERELTRRTEVFADVAQVFSTYERSTPNSEELRRGINSLAMAKDGDRWRIVSLSWTDETDEGPLPVRYLPRAT